MTPRKKIIKLVANGNAVSGGVVGGSGPNILMDRGGVIQGTRSQTTKNAKKVGNLDST